MCSATFTSCSGRHGASKAADVGPAKVPIAPHLAREGHRGHCLSRSLSAGEPSAGQFLTGEIEAATLWGVSFSGVAAHVMLSTSHIHHSGQATTKSLECACASSPQHSALTPCSKRSTGKQQSSPGRKEIHSPLHFHSLPKGIALQPRCQPGIRLPAFRATRATYLRLPGPQAVRRQIPAAKAKLAGSVLAS